MAKILHENGEALYPENELKHEIMCANKVNIIIFVERNQDLKVYDAPN